MVKKVELYSLFVSSTAEMNEEREVVSEVIDQINRQRGKRDGFQIQTLMWERDVAPDAGVRPQAYINSQIGDDYEIFIGFLCSKFGTPTDIFGSGTEEEFNIALRRKEDHGSLPKILFYFRDPRTADREIDAGQLLKVMEFKSSINDRAFYRDYKTSQEFRTYILDHLDKTISNIREEDEIKNTTAVEVNAAENYPIESAFTNESDDLGVMDLEEIASDRMADFVLVMQGLAASQEILTSVMNSATKETNDLNLKSGNAPDRRSVKRILGRVASHMDSYTKEVSSASLQLSNLFTDAIDATQSIIMIATEDGTADLNDVENLHAHIKDTRRTICTLKDHIQSFRDSVRSMPRMLQIFNRSKRDLVAALDELISFCDTAVRQINSVLERDIIYKVKN